MNSFQLESLVKVRTIEQIKKRKPDKLHYSMKSSECYANFQAPTEITGMITKIENGKYFVRVGDCVDVRVGDCVDKKFIPSSRMLVFTEIYMTRFARTL